MICMYGTIAAYMPALQGAQNVRCARCGEITPVPLAGGTKNSLQTLHDFGGCLCVCKLK